MSSYYNSSQNSYGFGSSSDISFSQAYAYFKNIENNSSHYGQCSYTSPNFTNNYNLGGVRGCMGTASSSVSMIITIQAPK